MSHNMKGEVINLIQTAEDEYRVSSLTNRSEPMIGSFLDKKGVDKLLGYSRTQGLKVNIKGEER